MALICIHTGLTFPLCDIFCWIRPDVSPSCAAVRSYLFCCGDKESGFSTTVLYTSCGQHARRRVIVQQLWVRSSELAFDCAE